MAAEGTGQVGSKLGRVRCAAGLFGKLDETLEEDLRRFKAYAEARQPAPVARR